MQWQTNSLTDSRSVPSASLDPLETCRKAEQPRSRSPISRWGWEGDSFPTLSEVFRHSGWMANRGRVYRSLQRTMAPVFRIAEFAGCGSRLRVFQSLTDPDVFKVGGSYCKDRFCTPCANMRARTIKANLLERMPHVRIRFLTLTLKADANVLSHRIDSLLSAFARLQRTKLWKTRVKGGCLFLEVKWSEHAQNWNAHVHVLVEGRYIPQSQLSETWSIITGGSYIVDIKLAKSREGVAKYAAKYASKPLDTSFLAHAELLDEAVVALKGRRLVSTFGTWRGMKLTEEPTAEGWQEIADLDELIQRTVNGDRRAEVIITRLMSDGMATAVQECRDRSPPPGTERLFTAPNGTQTLFDMSSFA